MEYVEKIKSNELKEVKNGSIDPVNEHNSKMPSFKVSGMKEYETMDEMFQEECIPWLQEIE